ncbi:peptidyl-prolyl cis-trans isomerase [Candidatus Saccharibacteria bacterium]|nr:peptidyl-prolyl cis-trans isomerase [Candidatus Saccharibacteria bacterium]
MAKVTKKIKDKFSKQEELHKTEKEKLDERREEILAQGRKFKYPMQFAKHRLVFITIAIAFVALIGAAVFGWVSLYKNQSTSDVAYRITTVLPVPVAKVDGENVRFSDYLMIYRSSIMPVEQQNGSSDAADDDTESIRKFYKRTALTEAEKYAYAIKLGKENNIMVSKAQINEAFNEHLKIGGAERSEDSFLKVLKDNFGLDKGEYQRMLYLSLMEVEVSKLIDVNATSKVEQAQKMLAENGGDFRAVADALGIEYEETGLIDIMNIDGGRSTKAYEMEPGQISEPFVSQNGDCYYIIKVLGKADAKVAYVSLGIPFTELNTRFAQLRDENKIQEYIELPMDGVQ